MRFRLLFFLPAMLLVAACAKNTTAQVTDTDTSSQDQQSSAAPIAEHDHDGDENYASSAAAMDDEGMEKDHDADDQTLSSSAASAPARQATVPSGARVINVSVTNWAFNPNTITVAKGENVVLHLTGISGEHSFAVPDLGINVAVNPGETKDITLPTDKTGTFQFRCMIPCGQGHRDMKGQLVIS